jgi:RHS repeat-associated protein
VNGGTSVTYYLADHLGSIVQETSAVGAVTLDREYDPWGAPLRGEMTSGYSYTGREWDAEVNLYYYRARYYSGETGRFISEDPLGLQGGTNLFGYASNRTVVASDPWGLFTSNVHIDVTYTAARLAGLGVIESIKLAIQTAAVDFRDGSFSQFSTVNHAMSSVGGRTTEEVFDRYVARSIERGDLAAALHAVQDSISPAHEGFQVWHPNEPFWDMVRHTGSEMLSVGERSRRLVEESVNIIKRARASNSCQ